jgi:hypothetical protein
MQVRHCLAHGLVRGFGPETWPGPLDKRSAKTKHEQGAQPAANDVLGRTRTSGKHAIHFWSAVCCARVYSVGAAVAADEVARYFGETVDSAKLHKFEDV